MRRPIKLVRLKLRDRSELDWRLQPEDLAYLLLPPELAIEVFTTH